MLRTLSCVTLALLFAGVSGWSQSGAYTTKSRVAPPAPTAPNPFSHANANPSPALFGTPTPQRFNASPFPDANRSLSIFIRNRIISQQRPGHGATQPNYVYVPCWTYPYVYPYYPYNYDLQGTNPTSIQPNGSSKQDSSFGVEGSTSAGEDLVNKASDVTFQSTPAGADIYIDGNFVGNTPSTVPLASGLHTISIKQWGYQDWQRTLTVTTGGKITIDAALREN